MRSWTRLLNRIKKNYETYPLVLHCFHPPIESLKQIFTLYCWDWTFSKISTQVKPKLKRLSRDTKLHVCFVTELFPSLWVLTITNSRDKVPLYFLYTLIYLLNPWSRHLLPEFPPQELLPVVFWKLPAVLHVVLPAVLPAVLLLGWQANRCLDFHRWDTRRQMGSRC